MQLDQQIEMAIIILVAVSVLGTAFGLAWRDTSRHS